MTGPSWNTVWARAFVDELARAGVGEVCLAPGSRSTPLVLACARREGLRIFTHLDERSAGFFALGVGRATGRPAVVVTTSGTATANLFPAVMEACQGEVPLVVLTADRPHRLRDSGANQAVDQLRLYGPYVRAFFEVAPSSGEESSLRHLRGLANRAVAEAAGSPPGPVHLNFPFEKPLEPRAAEGDPSSAEGPPGSTERGPGGVTDPRSADFEPGRDRPGRPGRKGERPFTRMGPRLVRASSGEADHVARLVEGSSRGLIVAGPSSRASRLGPGVVAFASSSGFPVLADPLSGVRYGPPGDALVLGRYDLYLRSPELRERLRPDLILRVGAPPTSSVLGDFLEEAGGARQIVVDAGHRWKDPWSVADEYVRSDPGHLLEELAGRVRRTADEEWRGRWKRGEKVAAEAMEEELQGPFFEGTALSQVVDALPEDGVLFVSSSMPVRDLDAFAPPRSRRIRVHGNRGASGIDGVVSSALGVSAGAGRPVVCVLGDLAFHHDMNGLLATREEGVAVVFVLLHNDGGGIFHLLPIREHEPEFTSYFATPHGLEFEHAARMYGLPHVRVEGSEALGEAVRRGLDSGGSRIVEVRTDRDENYGRHEEVVRRVLDALRAEMDEEVQG